MIEGATKMPEPITLPTISVVASSRPRPRTRAGGGSRGAAARALTRSSAVEILHGLWHVLLLRRQGQDPVETPERQAPDERQRREHEDPAQGGHSTLLFSPPADSCRRGR